MFSRAALTRASSPTPTYRWARQASTRSSCCSAAGPGSSGWLAPYPGSCWAWPSTAPYLPRDKRPSVTPLSAAHSQRSADQREEGGKKESKCVKRKRNCEKKSEGTSARRLSVSFACKVELDSGTLGAISWIRNRCWTLAEKFFFGASTMSREKASATPLNILICYSEFLTENKMRQFSVELGDHKCDLWTLPEAQDWGSAAPGPEHNSVLTGWGSEFATMINFSKQMN